MWLFPAIAILLLSILESVNAGGVFEIDDITLEVNGFKPRSPFQIRFCVQSSRFCVKKVTGRIVGGRSSYPMLFDNQEGSWNNHSLQVRLAMQNGPSVLFAELKNDVFWRHDWTEVRIQEPFYTLSFRHRFSCKEGFLGNICEYRVPEPTEAPSTTTQAQTVEASTTTEALLQSTYSSPPPKPTTAPPTLPSSTISTRLFPKAEEPFPLLPIANELATLAQETPWLLVGLLVTVSILAFCVVVLTLMLCLSERKAPQEEVQEQKTKKSDRISVNTAFTDDSTQDYKTMESMTSSKAHIFKLPIMYDYAEIV